MKKQRSAEGTKHVLKFLNRECTQIYTNLNPSHWEEQVTSFMRLSTPQDWYIKKEILRWVKTNNKKL